MYVYQFYINRDGCVYANIFIYYEYQSWIECIAYVMTVIDEPNDVHMAIIIKLIQCERYWVRAEKFNFYFFFSIKKQKNL
jgi:hypothetical protein